MNKRLHFFLLFLFSYAFYGAAQTETNLMDSLALVDFYQSTNGDNWSDNTNWLSGEPVGSWQGISVIDIQGEWRVSEIDLDLNNLSGPIPLSLNNIEYLDDLSLFNNSISFFPDLPGINPTVLDLGSNLLTSLPSFTGYTNTTELFLDGNFLSDLPDFLNLPSLILLWVQGNQLTFIDLFQPIGLQIPQYIYSPQDTFARDILYLKEGSFQDFCAFVPDASPNLSYQWFDSEGVPITGVSFSPCLGIEAIGPEVSGTYYLEVMSPQLPNLTLIGELEVVVLVEEEPGACYNPLEFIVQFQPGASEENVQALEDILSFEGASKSKECQCGDLLQLWTAPTVIDVEARKRTAEDQLDVDTTGNNYALIIQIQQETGGSSEGYLGPNFDGVEDDSVRVGIIDTGIGPFISLTEPVMYRNYPELASPGDDDGNCLVDDIEGYDFQNSTGTVVDEASHGSHVSGLVARDYPDDVALDMMDLRVHDGQIGFLFDASCAIYYAILNDARVINNSWGYYASNISPVLDVALQAALNEDVVMVCSAGNGFDNVGVNTDGFPHWPSSAEYDNIISVAAMTNFLDFGPQLAPFSNYGAISVDIAAEGTDIESTVPFEGLAAFSGTSMAAAFVSRTASVIRGRDASYSAQDVINCILNSSEFSVDLSGFVLTGGYLDHQDALLLCAPTVSVRDIHYEQLEVFPNPFHDYVAIRLPEGAWNQEVNLEVFDMIGGRVFSRNFSSTSLLVWDGKSSGAKPLPGGTYLYHLNIGKERYTGKLIKAF